MAENSGHCDWIAVDWGTSNLRCWAMDAAGRVIAEASSPDGMAGLKPADFEAVLLGVIGGWLGAGTMPVVASGMVGSRQGWIEAPYAAIPCAPRGRPVRVPTTDPRIAVHILPGLKQTSPPDVMRGEEIQIAGFLAGIPDFEGVLCLPGTHSKWAQVAGGAVTGFRTFLTGELFALLSRSSVLRHSVGDTLGEGFEQAVQETLDAPDSTVARLFEIRAADLLIGTSPADAHARLSGLLIGAELAATRGHWQAAQIGLIGAHSLSALYARALAVPGATTEIADAGDCTRKGLMAAYTEFVA